MNAPDVIADSASIAIVGIGCRFPGGIADPAGFWRLLRDGVDAITEIPPTRMDVARLFDPRPATPGRMMTRWGGFLEQVEDFDADFFGISPREAERLDPQQRLLLETAWEALEDAGQDVRRLEGSHTGVYVGQWLSDFEARLFADPENIDFLMTTGTGRYAASGRISYAFGLRGPSLTLDTACSSSLVAVHLAVRSIRTGESQMALAGGVNVILQPHISVAYSQSRMMAPDGRCKFADAAGDGYVRSEGVGLVVLKALQRAVADGDRIYAVIRGSAVNNDGRSSGSMGTPSRIGQEELLHSAYRDAGVSAGAVGYVEAHGTGTRAGDPVELGALAAVLGTCRLPGDRARVGSVKTNFGHTEGAAGIAGLIKVALSLHHGAIAPSLHCQTLTPAIEWPAMPFEIARQGEPWPAGAGSRLGGVSAFGIAGTNAHVVLEQAPAAAATSHSRRALPTVALLVLSAKNPAALRALARRHAEGLEADGGAALTDVCWNAATRRTSLDHRAAFVAADRAGMADALRRYVSGEAAAAEGVVDNDKRPTVAFVFPGQGGQWPGMARDLMDTEPVFRAAIERCDAAARPYLDVSIGEQLRAVPGAEGDHLDRIDVIQPVLVAVAIAYAELWRSIGVEPDAVVGHSMGEVGAACIAGVLTLDQAMHIVCARSALMRRTSGQGAMALVELSMAEAEARIRGHENRIAVAASNSPRSSVISGQPEAVQAVMSALERDGVFCRLVKVDVASHSPQMDAVAKELHVALKGLAPSSDQLPIYSTVLGRQAEGSAFDASYWAANVRKPVLFADTVERLAAAGVTVFIELGPHPILLPSIQQTTQALGLECTVLACGRRDEPQQAELVRAVGGLACSGYALDWQRVMPGGGRHVSLPSYPWQRERHWIEDADIRPPQRHAPGALGRPDEESMTWLHQLVWQAIASAPPPDSPHESWLVVADDLSHADPVAAALRTAGATASATHLPLLETVLAVSAATRVLVLAPDRDDVAYLPLRVLQAVLSADVRLRPRLWFATRGAQSVGTPTRVSVMQAALWGSARVVGEEHPELWGGLVDVDPTTDVASGATSLAQQLVAADGEDQVALRGVDRFGLRVLPIDRRKARAPMGWRADAAYLITGGLGDIGLQIARTLVQHGVRRLVLLGRTPLPPREFWSGLDPESTAGRRVAAVRGIETLGASVHVGAVDVGDEAQISQFLTHYQAEGWPPIRGVIHAAGAFDNRLASAMDRVAFEAVLTSKLRGAQLLDRLLPELDLFVLFSSTGAFLAQPGQANYAAANAGLDALAFDRRARGQPAQSIAWGVWADTGLVRNEAGARNVAEMGRQGIRAFSAERGIALFDWLCGGLDTTLAVLPVDWAGFAVARAGRPSTLFREVLAGALPDATSTISVGDRSAVASPVAGRSRVEAVVRDAVCKVLKIAPSRLHPRKTLGDMGLSSLMAMELRNRLEAALGQPLSATLAWNHPTVNALVDHLTGASAPVESVAAPASPPASTDVMSVRLTDLAALSEDEATLALRTRQPPAR